jgi:hypothetical protein
VRNDRSVARDRVTLRTSWAGNDSTGSSERNASDDQPGEENAADSARKSRVLTTICTARYRNTEAPPDASLDPSFVIDMSTTRQQELYESISGYGRRDQSFVLLSEAVVGAILRALLVGIALTQPSWAARHRAIS